MYYSPTPFPIRLRVAIGKRDPERFPADAAALGHSLAGLAEAVITDREKLPRPVALVIMADQVEQYDLAAVIQAKADVHRFIAAAAGQPGVEAVALVGALGVRFGPRVKPRPALVTFIEWTDCRWWSGVRPLHERRLREDWPAMERSAEEGYPRPGGMGGWFSRARREGLKLRMNDRTQPGLGMVH